MESKKWGKTEIEIVKAMLDEGKSHREIAERFKCSKNTIIGVIWRRIKGLKRTLANGHNENLRPLLNYDAGFNRTKDSEDCEKRKRIADAKTRLAVASENVVFFPDPRFLSDKCCRAIIGEVSLMTCCGNKPLEGHVYCEAHHTLYSEKVKRNDTERLARIFK